MHTPLPPQKWPYLHERCPQCWIEWKFLFQIFLIFSFLCYDWLHLQYAVTHQVCHRLKQSCSKRAKFTGKMRIALKISLVFEIWSIFMYQPYTKSTISQKLKIALKKTHELKNLFQNMRIFWDNIFAVEIFGRLQILENCEQNLP